VDANIDFNCPFQKRKTSAEADVFLFWIPPPKGRLHSPVIEMLGMAKPSLRQDFRLWRKGLYGANAPPAQKGRWAIFKTAD